MFLSLEIVAKIRKIEEDKRIQTEAAEAPENY